MDNALRRALGSPARPPGPPIARAALNVREFFADPVGFLAQQRQQHGPLYHVGMGKAHYYILTEPDLIHEVLVSRADLFAKDERSLRDLSRVVGQGLLTSSGERWRRQRKLAAPTLKRAQIGAYAQTMRALTLHALEQDERLLGARQIERDMMSLTLNIVVATLFRATLPDQIAQIELALHVLLQDFARHQHTLWRFFSRDVPTPYEREYRRSKATLDAIMDALIAARRADLDQEGDDLLYRLLIARDDDGRGMSDEQLRDEVLTIFLAGHETTALTLSYALHELAYQPALQELIAREVRALDDQALSSPQAWPQHLPWTRAVVQESLRMHPPAWIMSRQATQATTLGDWTLPKDSHVIISPWLLHHDDRFFDRPEDFNPTRWLDGQLERALPKHAYMPFGAGARVCIGNHFAMMEAIIALATIVEATRQVRYRPAITLRPDSPLMITLTPRRHPQPGSSR